MILCPLPAKSRHPDLGTIRFEIDGKRYHYKKMGVAILKKQKFKRIKVILGFEDISMRSHFFISFLVAKKKLQRKLELSTEYNQLHFIFRNIDGNFLAKPLADYFPGQKKHSLRWSRLAKAEKLATGVGVVDNREEEGTLFYVNVQPVYDGDTLIELKGNFHGKIRYSHRYENGFTYVDNGHFYVEIVP